MLQWKSSNKQLQKPYQLKAQKSREQKQTSERPTDRHQVAESHSHKCNETLKLVLLAVSINLNKLSKITCCLRIEL